MSSEPNWVQWQQEILWCYFATDIHFRNHIKYFQILNSNLQLLKMLIIYTCITIKIFDYYFYVLSKTGKIPSLTSIFRVVYSTETLSENKCDMIPHDTLTGER